MKKVYFQYKSIGNFVRLLMDIRLEKSSKRDNTVYHARFDNESDDFYEELLERCFPEGGTLGEEQIQRFTEYILAFMQKDKICKRKYLEYDKSHCKSYVYFKVDEVLTPVESGEHARIIYEVCVDYFKDFDVNTLEPEYIKHFICNNFEIRSDFSTIETVANSVAADRCYLIREMIGLNRRK